MVDPVVPVKSKVKISQNFVAFSEYMNFTITLLGNKGNSFKILIQTFCLLLHSLSLTPSFPPFLKIWKKRIRYPSISIVVDKWPF